MLTIQINILVFPILFTYMTLSTFFHTFPNIYQCNYCHFHNKSIHSELPFNSPLSHPNILVTELRCNNLEQQINIGIFNDRL